MKHLDEKIWSTRSKTYKINYFGALQELFKQIESDSENKSNTVNPDSQNSKLDNDG